MWRTPLVFQGEAIGSIAEPLAEQMLQEGVDSLRGLRGEPMQLLGEPSAGLAEIAAWLRGHGYAVPWRDELVSVATSGGRIIGCVERAVVRNLGIATQAVQLHGCVQGSDQYWLQQRVR